jgi:hypothetical protein
VLDLSAAALLVSMSNATTLAPPAPYPGGYYYTRKSTFITCVTEAGGSAAQALALCVLFSAQH